MYASREMPANFARSESTALETTSLSMNLEVSMAARTVIERPAGIAESRKRNGMSAEFQRGLATRTP
jgi:hypothetical protein